MTDRTYVVPAGQERLWDRLHYAPAVVDETGTVWCSGVIGTEDDGSLADDPLAQFRRAFTNLDTVLTEAGCSMADVVDMTSFHVECVEFDFDLAEGFGVEPGTYYTTTAVTPTWTKRSSAKSMRNSRNCISRQTPWLSFL
jgi:enamine deaminase RidA (YjgF/YER057c/UK114 family)